MKFTFLYKFCLALTFVFSFIVLSSNVYARDKNCSLRYPEKCRSTNQLSWSPGFKAKIAQFLQSAEFQHPMRKGNSPSVEAIRNLSGVSQGVENYPDYMLFKGCSAHACFAGSAIAVSKHGHGILGIALAQPIDCAQCDLRSVENYAVTIFVLQDNHLSDLETSLKQWGISKVAKEVSNLNTSIQKQQDVQQAPPVYVVAVKNASGTRSHP